MNYIKIILLILGILFLASCTHLRQPSSLKYISWHDRQVNVQQHKNWFVVGMLSCTRGKKRDTAHLEWKQQDDKYELTIAGPMNLNKVKIIGNANRIWFCQANNKCTWAKSPEDLFLKQFGWKFPVSNIKYWMLAIPAPTKIGNICFDQFGHLVAFEQAGWKVCYTDFKTIDGVDLPGMIELCDGNLFIKFKAIKQFL